MKIRSLAPSSNETLILTALQRGVSHGYQLATNLERQSGGYFRFRHGTLYPILHRLEKGGLIEGTWSDAGPGRRRKHYQLTELGRKQGEIHREAWRRFARHFFAMIGETDQ